MAWVPAESGVIGPDARFEKPWYGSEDDSENDAIDAKAVSLIRAGAASRDAATSLLPRRRVEMNSMSRSYTWRECNSLSSIKTVKCSAQ